MEETIPGDIPDVLGQYLAETLAIVCVQKDLDPIQSGSLYEIRPNNMFIKKYPNLCVNNLWRYQRL